MDEQATQKRLTLLDAKVNTFAAKLGSSVVALFAAPMAPVAMAA